MNDNDVLAFDLETIADPAIMDILPSVKANGNLKDPAKIIKDLEEKQQKQIKELGLNPLHNLICAFGYSDGKSSGYLTLTDENSERELLLDMWDILNKYDHFTTFNGRQFDMRCLYLHGLSHDIIPPVAIDRGRYNRGNHTDLRQTLSGSDPYAPGKLDFYCKKFLNRGKREGIDGERVQDYWDMGLIEDIGMYGMDDAELTHELFVKARRCGLIQL